MAPHRFEDAVTLVEDFWAEVDRLFREGSLLR
jgi:hypothetical protein